MVFQSCSTHYGIVEDANLSLNTKYPNLNELNETKLIQKFRKKIFKEYLKNNSNNKELSIIEFSYPIGGNSINDGYSAFFVKKK